MGTKWKKFRYGTEDTNPARSFYTTILCLGFLLILCGYAEVSGNLSAWAYSFIFGLLALVSLAHLNMTVCNEKRCVVPVQILDKKWPDLLLAVTRHLLSKKLVSSLFFARLFQRIRTEGEKLAVKWHDYQERAARRGEPVKQWSRRRHLALWVQTVVLVGSIIFVGVVNFMESEVLPLGILAVIIFLYHSLTEMYTAEELGTIMDEIHRMSEDAFVQEEPKLKPYSLFRVPEEELLSIQRNRKESLEKQLQSERMKVELITNVSHDLKTPLTSMIGCIDLLKKTEGLPEEANDYVELLSGKAEKLREMIQDVFDMEKAASSQNLNMERLDMTRLIRQTLADMQDRIEESGLIFRVKMEDRELPFMGDGKKLYRVYQNLIENTLKYSMEGSRVYLKVQESEGQILTSIKNTSACEMDFCEEEILERFTRGDKSRSTEGNGLGLAIAKSFTEGCGGSFRLTLDGDLFKVETSFSTLHSSEK